ncbi:MAG: DUF885 family protein [Acidobacteriota bacterium]
MLPHRCLLPLLLSALWTVPAAASPQAPIDATTLERLVDEALAVSTPTRSAAEYAAAVDAYRDLLERLDKLDSGALPRDGQIDAGLLRRHLRTRLFEIEDARLHELVPVRYFALHGVSGLFLRPCSGGPEAVRGAIRELEAQPAIFESARANLTRPARTWTENAIVQARYAEHMLADLLPQACVEDPDLEAELLKAGAETLESVRGFARWLKADLLPRSDRPPTWTPEQIEVYQFEHEGLESWGVDAMLDLAAAEETRLLEEMNALAKRIHPSGDLHTVWELMKEEAPPWPEVEAMARWYVDHSARWLRSPAGDHLVTIPDFDYGVRTTPPMARRILSFGGASYGPTVAGRLSGYYVLTPFEPWLDDDARRARLKAYNPYWTHVISYHEWLGHTVQRAHALSSGTLTPMRRAYRGIYLSQAWSFYLEKLLEAEGYYDTLPHLEALKTRMARRQMRMWRVQRILTKLRMAKGTMTFEQAVDAYVQKIGMEPENAHIEVQRDSQSPSPPGREIVGELLIEQYRDEARKRMGEHFTQRRFHDRLLRWGDLPLPVVRRLLFDE